MTGPVRTKVAVAPIHLFLERQVACSRLITLSAPIGRRATATSDRTHLQLATRGAFKPFKIPTVLLSRPGRSLRTSN